MERVAGVLPEDVSELPFDELTRLVEALEIEMQKAATELRFEYAARLRDEIRSTAPRIEGGRLIFRNRPGERARMSR